ncbi:MAG: glycoside hydrolase family 3 protein [Treponema sp.]|nr:glycoside hydrolase family 3 protein [Treponema sp.]
MTLEQKICQMLMPSVYVRGRERKTGAPLTELDARTGEILQKYDFGGIILFNQNITGTVQVTKLIHDIQNASISGSGEIPLLLGVDQEGGNVFRLETGCWMPGNMLLGATGNPELAQKAAALIGSEVKAVGFNVNFAPAADVNNNPSNPVIGLRSFSSNQDLAAKMVVSSIKGYQDAGVISALKHFPGHGDTNTDTHVGLSIIQKTYDELNNLELVPFKAGIEAGAQMVMTAHIQFPKIEEETYNSISTKKPIYLPATLSHKMITEILRGDLGFDGVVTTDAMDMGAITKHFDPVDAATLAINAGIDILLMAGDISTENQITKIETLISSLITKVEEGAIQEKTIDEAVLRILKLKIKNGILDYDSGHLNRKTSAAKKIVGSKENHLLEWEITQKGITLLKNDDALPIDADEEKSTLIFYPYRTEDVSVNYAVTVLKDSKIIPQNADIQIAQYNTKTIDVFEEQILNADSILIISELKIPSQLEGYTNTASRFQFVLDVIDMSHENGKKISVICATLPYDAALYSDADAIITCYGAQEMEAIPTTFYGETEGYGPNIPVAITTAFGLSKPTGILPVDIFAIDPVGKFTDKIVYPIGSGLGDFKPESLDQIEIEADNESGF